MEPCIVCKKISTTEENEMKCTGCCFSYIHEMCTVECAMCPVCKDRLQVLDKVKRTEKFTPE